MSSVSLRSTAGAEVGSVELSDDVFGIQPNVPVMHQVATAQLAHRRAGSHSTKTRSEVRGGGRKPYRQKGTGNARQGSTRAPQWAGGGVALGPKPRSYAQRTPKKMIRLALRSALSDRAARGKVVVVDDWGFDVPRTRDAQVALSALGIEGGVLVVVGRDDEAVIKSFRNLPEAQLIDVAELNAYDVLCNEWIIFTQATLPGADTAEPAEDEGTGGERRAARRSEHAARGGSETDAEPADENTGGDGSASDEPQAETGGERRAARRSEHAARGGSETDAEPAGETDAEPAAETDAEPAEDTDAEPTGDQEDK
jgi:large subunit ribosomal protein L4